MGLDRIDRRGRAVRRPAEDVHEGRRGVERHALDRARRGEVGLDVRALARVLVVGETDHRDLGPGRDVDPRRVEARDVGRPARTRDVQVRNDRPGRRHDERESGRANGRDLRQRFHIDPGQASVRDRRIQAGAGGSRRDGPHDDLVAARGQPALDVRGRTAQELRQQAGCRHLVR